MKSIHVYTLFLMSVFYTSGGQKQTAPHKDNINYNINDLVTSYGPNTTVRNVKQDRNGNILIAASWSFKVKMGRNNMYCPTCYFPLIINQYILL